MFEQTSLKPPARRVFLRRSAPDVPVTERRRWFFRHPLPIRVTHWINALCFFLLLMSGYQIFNAHPALYWGKASNFDAPLLSMDAAGTDGENPKGITTVFGHAFDTTGVFGLSYDAQGAATQTGFPGWLTIPSTQDLAVGRRWHFLFAWLLVLNGLAYVLYGLASGQLRWRVIPSRDQLAGFWTSVREHLTLQFPKGDEAKRYNVIQKITYFLVIFVLFPVQILAGLTMSPGMDTAAPWLLALFGGRQSARTVHFVIANLLFLFLLVHVVLVIVSGLWNNLRGMVTGWFVLDRTRLDHDAG